MIDMGSHARRDAFFYSQRFGAKRHIIQALTFPWRTPWKVTSDWVYGWSGPI